MSPRIPGPGSDEILEILGRAPLFRGLPEQDLRSLREIGLPRFLEMGEMIFRERELSPGFFLVLTGRVKLFKLNPAGKEQILHVHGPGETCAEATLPEGSRLPASAEALDNSHLLLFPRIDFQRLLGRRPAIATNLIAQLSKRVREMVAMVEDLSLREAPARLARYLLDLAHGSAKPGSEVRLPIKKGELASLLGTRQETISRAFRKLADQGVVIVRGGRITLSRPDLLAEIAEGETAFP